MPYNTHEKRAAQSRTNYAKIRAKVYGALGGKCVRCGFSDPRALQVDHIFGDGEKDRQKMSWPAFYRHVLEALGSKYQLLCANCNQIKKHEKREFPKGRPRGLSRTDKYKNH